MRCRVWKLKISLLLCLLLLLSGCGNADKQTIRFFSMDTVMQITAYDASSDALSAARSVIESAAADLDATDPHSALSQVRSGDDLTQPLLEPLQIAQRVGAETNGALDVTLYPITDAWGFYTKQYRVPTDAELAKLLQMHGTWRLENTRYFCTDGVKLDLGSVAKGYAADLAVQALRDNAVASAVLSLGGNVQTLGTKPDGSLWTVSVTDPENPESVVGNLHVGETAVVTSGSYQRFFTDNGVDYHHILDPATGKPARTGLQSATVLCQSGALADALSTACFVLGAKKTLQLYDSGTFSFEAVLITEDHRILVTEGVSDQFEKTNENYPLVQILQ